MSYRHFSAIAAMLVISGVSASAQKTAIATSPTQTALRSSLLTPLATSTFAPTSFGGTFNGSPITIGLSWVTLNSLTDPVLLGLGTGSSLALGTPQGIPNGNYSVVLTIPWSNEAATVQFTGRGGAEVATCAVQQQLSYAAGAPIQRCDTGVIPVTDGNLGLIIRIKNPNPTCQTCVAWPQQMTVSQITLNLWR